MEHCDGEIPDKRPNHSDGGGGGSEDSLSALPDDILIHILLKLLDAAAAARTSVLSSRWRRLGRLLPELRLPIHADPHRVRLALESLEAPALHYVGVSLLDASPESLAAWLPIAASRLSGHLCIDATQTDEAEEGGAIELPCFEKATSIRLELGYLGLAVPPLGVFAQLTDLFLACIKLHGPCMLGDAVSSPRCPALRTLTIHNAWGLGNLAIHSDSLLEIKLWSLHGLQQLTVIAPALKRLSMTSCFAQVSSNDQPVANISAPELLALQWWDAYDPRFTQFGKMKNLQWLSTYPFLVYKQDNYAPNNYCLRLLRRFELMKNLKIVLIYCPDITNQQYLMEDITRLPDIKHMELNIMPEGHSFGASVLHVLRMCTGVRTLLLTLIVPTSNEVQPVCPSGCICDHPSNWKTEELVLNLLQEVDIQELRGTEHEAALVRRLIDWATVLKRMTVAFHPSVSESTAKEFFQMLQSFSGPEICVRPRFSKGIRGY